MTARFAFYASVFLVSSVGIEGDAEETAKLRLVRAARAVLWTPELFDKASLSRAIHKGWSEDQLWTIPEELASAFEKIGEEALQAAPDQPARPAIQEVQPKEFGHRKLKGGQKGLLTTLAHAESQAIDIMWDGIARFGGKKDSLPLEFYNDFSEAAAQEAQHFLEWCGRLEAIRAPYDPATMHNGLWESAARSSADLAHRLVVFHCVQEAQGLDTYEASVAKLKRCRDVRSAELLQRTMVEELDHIRKGVKWLKWLADSRGVDANALFREAVSLHFKKGMAQKKAPFNVELRDEAGMPRSWYTTLIV